MEEIIVNLSELVALLHYSGEPLLRWLQLPSVEVLCEALQESDLGEIHASLV